MENPSEQMKNAINNSKLSTVQELLNFLSVEAVYNLLKNLGGCTITLPKLDSFLKKERNEKIKKIITADVHIHFSLKNML